MKNFIALCMFFVAFSQKVTAQTFKLIEDSMIVDSYIEVINPNHRFTGDPNQSYNTYAYDKKGRVKSVTYVMDSIIVLMEYSYNPQSYMTTKTYDFYLNVDCHWYYSDYSLCLVYLAQNKFH